MVMSKEDFEKTLHTCTYEEYKKCYCPDCKEKENCIHRDAFRRYPKSNGGLGLCPNLNK